MAGFAARPVPASAAEQIQPLCRIAVPYRRPAGAPKPSDVCFSSRSKHPQNDKDPHDSFRTASAFHATRFDWVYTQERAFVEQAKKGGYGFWCAINSMVPDAPGGGRTKGRLTDLDGNLVTAPWMRGWKGAAWGCVNSPPWRQSYLTWAKTCLDAGTDGFQMDDPPINYAAVRWGACFCDHCLNGFRAFLERKTTLEQRRSIRVPDVATFDYRAYLKEKGAPSGDAFAKWDGGTLKGLFTEFQKESVRTFYADMRAEIDKVAGRHVTFSSNNYDGRWTFPYDLFEFGMAELPGRNARPDRMYERFREARKRGKAQLFTLVSGDTGLTRRVIAHAYACGGHLIVPWDVYMGSDAARYFGKPEQYADLYKFVRDHAAFFDGYEDAAFAIPGLEDQRYAARPPVAVRSAAMVSAVVRAMPGNSKAPVVIHLVDWRDSTEPFDITLENRRFFAERMLTVTLLRPGKQTAKLTGTSQDGRTSVRVPALQPWCVLVVTPGATGN
ncbi:MAG: hypothetical protein ACC645_04900 [Pirellulales bacterium]